MKTLRPEHSSFLCPPQPSSPRIYLSVVATWISTGFLPVYTLFQSLLLFLKGCWLNLRSAFISHPHLAILFLPACPSSQVCPDPSWIHQDFPSPPLLPAFITPPARPPSSLTAAKSTGLRRALSSSCSSSHSEDSASPAADPPPQSEKCCSSANIRQDPSPGLNIQVNLPAMPNSSLFFMVPLLFCMNNRCLSGCCILQRRFFPFFPSLSHRAVLPSGSCFTYLLPLFPSPLG